MTRGPLSISFAKDIRPQKAFDLSGYDDVRSNADAILGKVSAGSMPCDRPWPQDQVDFFRRWVEEGMKAYELTSSWDNEKEGTR